MGAHSCEQIGHGATAQESDRPLCAEARHDYGHSGYSGTIATTRGFLLATHNVLPTRAARQMAADLINQSDPRLEKWGKYGCISIAEAYPCAFANRELPKLVGKPRRLRENSMTRRLLRL